ncbi:MAG: hypothetical protein ACRDS9_26845 [Pseudonocardiaceae bacterium]
MSFSPDGLTEHAIDALLREVDAAAATESRPTSALLDGSAAEQRQRRMERRTVAAVVRALPVRRGASGPDGREAA